MNFNNFKYISSVDTSVSQIFYQRGLPDSSANLKIRSLSLNVENDGQLEFKGNLRAMIMAFKESKISIVPYFNVQFFNWNPTFTPVDSRFDTLPSPQFANSVSYTYEYKYFNINGGIGINMPVLLQLIHKYSGME